MLAQTLCNVFHSLLPHTINYHDNTTKSFIYLMTYCLQAHMKKLIGVLFKTCGSI